MWPFSTIRTPAASDADDQRTTATSTTIISPDSSSATDVNEESNICQLKCPMEQKALVSCVDSIRAARASIESSSDDSSGGEGKSAAAAGDATTTPPCLLPAVEAWTKCCAEANNQAIS
jgi:hypothetical protein